MGFGEPIPGQQAWTLRENESLPYFKQAIELGINFWDTANYYTYGSSEEIVGQAIKKYSRREDIVLSTKVGLPMHYGPGGNGLSRRAIFEQVEASLRRLDTDYIDLYSIHRWDPNTPVEETMEALNDIVRSGKVRYLGASSMYAWQFAEMQHVAAKNGWAQFISMQNLHNLVFREEEREMFGLLDYLGVGSITYSPLAKGRLALPWGARTERMENDPPGLRFDIDDDKPIVDAVERIAKERGVAMAQVSMAWLYTNSVIDAPILGPAHESHLPDAVGALHFTLTEQEVSELEKHYRPHEPLNVDGLEDPTLSRSRDQATRRKNAPSVGYRPTGPVRDRAVGVQA
ncbi:aldo/keto reductase [Citricoccus sp. NPDC055426]|uniref:aldo/keto reductase n=1 Tax=Citricoccus sp. NPDC055426 TaxID=3155536 RepID=UPI00342FA2C1